MDNKYQKRYLKHQKRKKEVLTDIIAERHSERQFGDLEIDIKPIIKAIEQAPSSCDRKAISYKIITERYEKNLLSGLLVGGTGWIHRADKIVLLFANSIAYKGKDEIDYMPYLDAGVIIGQVYLQATANDYAICFCNPHSEYKDVLIDKFGEEGFIFCGAIAIGHYDKKSKYSIKINRNEMEIKR